MSAKQENPSRRQGAETGRSFTLTRLKGTVYRQQRLYFCRLKSLPLPYGRPCVQVHDARNPSILFIQQHCCITDGASW